MTRDALFYRLRSFVVIAAIVLAVPKCSDGQWTKVADHILDAIPSDCCGFGCITFRDGVAWAGHNAIFNSLDSGATWHLVSPSFGGTVTQMDFFDRNTGLAATRVGLFITHNQGKTWTLIIDHTECFSCSFAGSPERIVATCDAGGFFYSTDGGASWRVMDPHDHELPSIGLPDGTAYAHSGSDRTTFGTLQMTTDFGATWGIVASPIDYDCWGLAIDSCNRDNIYLMNEEGHIQTDDSCQIFRINRKSGIRDTIFSRPRTFIVGSMSFSPNAMYIGTRDSGVYRTTDEGKAWKTIGGPSINNDTHLLCAITDNLILTADNAGSIWRTTNSGGDPIAPPASGPSYNFTLSSAKIVKDSFNITVRLPIFVHHMTVLPSIDMVMHYPAASLTYLGAFLVSGKSIDVAGSRWAGRAKLHVDAADLSALTDSLLGYAAFQWTPYESDCALIDFDSIPVITQTGPCTSSETISNKRFRGIIGSYDWCGTDGVPTVSVPASGPLFRITPNPARASATIHSSLFSGDATVRVYDASGRLVSYRDGMLSPSTPVVIDLSGLATGNYRVIVEGGSVPAYSLPLVVLRR